MLEFLKNRPKDMIECCLQKIDLAESIDYSHVVQVRNGVFKVCSFSRNPIEKPHGLEFVDNNKMPNYTCPEWSLFCCL